jgi:SAM-dependent methyltransferase
MAGPTPIFDRALLDQRRRRALNAHAEGADFLLQAVVHDLVDRLAAVQRRFALAADIVSPTPLLADALAATGQVDRIIRMDRLAEALNRDYLAVAGDEEMLPFAPECLDLVVSLLGLQWTNDLPGALAQIRRALRPDGLFLAAIVGGDSLIELRESLTAAEAELTDGASPRVAPLADVRALGMLLQRAGFALPVVDRDRRIVRYGTAIDLMRDLRAMGATSVLANRDRRPLLRAVVGRAAAIYAERFADPDGRVRATFDVISLSGWAPHDSQQRPLRPGSATARLAEALGTVEQSTGDKAGRLTER